MVVLVGGKGPSILGFPRGRKFPSVPSLFMSYFFSGNSRGYLYFLLSELIEEVQDEGERSGQNSKHSMVAAATGAKMS